MKTVPGAHIDDGHLIVSLILRNKISSFELQVHTIMSPTIPALPLSDSVSKTLLFGQADI